MRILLISALLSGSVFLGCGGGDMPMAADPGGGTPPTSTGAAPVLFPTAVNTGFDENGQYKVPVAASGATGLTWSSSDPTIASVAGTDALAVITGLKAGTATITATAGGKSATVTVTVAAYKAADKTAGQTAYTSNGCNKVGCHDASGPDITPSGIGKHSDMQITAAATMGANPEGGAISIGAAAHSFKNIPNGISPYLRSLPSLGTPQQDQ
jgi:hypothetical protein